jgi:hypothetical protein
VVNVFPHYFQRKLASGILTALLSVASLPTDILLTTILYLVELRQLSLDDHVQLIDNLLRSKAVMTIALLENTVLTNSKRGFSWMERDRPLRTKNMPAEAKVIKSWSGQSFFKEVNIPGKSTLDGNNQVLLISEFELNKLKSYAWQVAAPDSFGRIHAYGFTGTAELAAEEAYKAFFEAITTIEFEKANAWVAGKDVVLIGSEVNAEEYKKLGSFIPMPAFDDRNTEYFVTPAVWGKPVTKHTLPIEKVTKDGEIILKGGAKFIPAFHTIYIRHPEQYVTTEVACKKCSVISIPHNVGGRYLQSRGYHCGPCIEYLCDCGELHDNEID